MSERKTMAVSLEISLEVPAKLAMMLAPEGGDDVYRPGRATIDEKKGRRLLQIGTWGEARFARPPTATETQTRRDAEFFDEEYS